MDKSASPCVFGMGRLMPLYLIPYPWASLAYRESLRYSRSIWVSAVNRRRSSMASPRVLSRCPVTCGRQVRAVSVLRLRQGATAVWHSLQYNGGKADYRAILYCANLPSHTRPRLTHSRAHHAATHQTLPCCANLPSHTVPRLYHPSTLHTATLNW